MWTFPKLDRPTVFIAAPGDVKYLRTAAVAEIEQLAARSADPDQLAIYDWMVDKSDSGFDDWLPAQGQIPLPSDPNCRAVVCAFGERIGTPLPADFPLDAIGRHADTRSRRGYGAALPYDDADPPPHSFAITGTVFEYLAALAATQTDADHAPPVLLLFIGDNSIRDDTDLLDANFGGRRLYDAAQRRFKPSELRRWENTSYLPQLAQIRHFCRYVQDQGVVVKIVPDELAACAAIRRFLLDKLGLCPRADARDPFKGLESYGIDDADLLYGREQERREAIAELKAVWADPRRPNALCILGGSGSGKSSFLKAGLLADLQRPIIGGGHAGLAVQPKDLADAPAPPAGSVPTALAELLCRALRAIDPDADTAAALRQLAEARADLQPAKAVAALLEQLGRKGADWRLIIGIDQFEELLDQWQEPDGQARWRPVVDLLLLAAREPRIAVAYTLQLNRTERIASDPRLGPFWTGGGIQLLGFPRQGLKAIIENPFAFKGIRLEPDLARELQTRILAFAERGDAETQASLLPLVSMTLRNLYQAAAPKDPPPDTQTDAEPPETLLRLDDCRERLDIADAIAALARAARGQASDETLGKLLRRLVRIRGADRELLGLPTVRLPDDPAERTLAAALAERRLLLHEPPDRIRLVHEAVIHHWPEARAWLADERIHLDRATALAADAREWRARDFDDAFLASAGRRDVDRAADVLSRFFDSLSRCEAEDADGDALLRRYCLALLGAHPEPGRVVAVSENRNRHVHLAADYGDTDLIERYVRHDSACVTATNNKLYTPLRQACVWGHAAVVRLLLAAGADVEAADDEGWRPLQIAANKGHLETLELLLAAGADVEAATKDGWRALHNAARYGHLACLERLLNAGASPTARSDPAGWTCLHLATIEDHVSIVERLLAEADVDPDGLTANGESVLYVAAGNGSLASVKRLLATNRIDLDRLGGAFGFSALHTAAWHGFADIADALLDAGANPNLPDRQDRTPLEIALSQRQTRFADLLVTRGADVNQPDRHGQTLLHKCAAGWQAEIVQYNQVSIAGEVARFLLANGARVDALDLSGQTPIQIAVRSGNTEVIDELLKQEGALEAAASNGLLHLAARVGQTEVVQALLDLGLSPNLADSAGWTPLHEAAQEGRSHVASMLIEHGADIKRRANDPPITPLVAAAQTGQFEVIQELRARGADSSQKRDRPSE
jgi:ankyrin repeat protein